MTTLHKFDASVGALERQREEDRLAMEAADEWLSLPEVLQTREALVEIVLGALENHSLSED